MKFKPDNTIKYEIGQTVGICTYLGGDYYKQYATTRSRFAKFECPCGEHFEAAINKVKGRNAKCPVCAAANLAAIQKGNITHGLSKSQKRLYHLWTGIKDRCYNPDSEFFYRYGGRGIKMWEGWLNDFKAFFDYITTELPPWPGKGYSLDRIENDEDYKPFNLKWSTQKEQVRNSTQSTQVEWEGNMVALSELSERFNINHKLVWERYVLYGMSLEEALTKPSKYLFKTIVDMQTGIFYDSINDASRAYNIPKTTLSRYLHNPEKNKTSLAIV